MSLIISGRTFQSRLLIGTGKYRSFQEMARCHAASGAEVVTVAVRRVNLTDRRAEAHDYSLANVFPRLGETGTSEQIIALLNKGRAK